jgi:hypothetical protein
MLKTFLCFHLDNNFIEEREVKSRDIPITDIPKTAYAYQFYDKNVVEDEDGELVIRKDFGIEELRDEVREFIAPSDEADYSEKIDYVEDYLGLDTFKDEIRDISKGSSDIIDIDVVADECIEEDGIAHFVASYDGEEIELDDDLYAYRMN